MRYLIFISLHLFLLQANAQQKSSIKAGKATYHMPNLHQFIKASQGNTILPIVEFLDKVSSYGEHLEKLSGPQRTFYLNQTLESELNNGGLSQYFSNSSGDYAVETLTALRAIKAYKTLGIFKSAIAKFPGAQVPKDQKKRSILIAKLDPDIQIWEALDKKFLAYPDNLTELNLKFIKANITEF